MGANISSHCNDKNEVGECNSEGNKCRWVEGSDGECTTTTAVTQCCCPSPIETDIHGSCQDAPADSGTAGGADPSQAQNTFECNTLTDRVSCEERTVCDNFDDDNDLQDGADCDTTSCDYIPGKCEAAEKEACESIVGGEGACTGAGDCTFNGAGGKCISTNDIKCDTGWAGGNALACTETLDNNEMQCQYQAATAAVNEACVDTDGSGDDCSGFVAGDVSSCGDCDYTAPQAATEAQCVSVSQTCNSAATAEECHAAGSECSWDPTCFATAKATCAAVSNTAAQAGAATGAIGNPLGLRCNAAAGCIYSAGQCTVKPAEFDDGTDVPPVPPEALCTWTGASPSEAGCNDLTGNCASYCNIVDDYELNCSLDSSGQCQPDGCEPPIGRVEDQCMDLCPGYPCEDMGGTPRTSASGMEWTAETANGIFTSEEIFNRCCIEASIDCSDYTCEDSTKQVGVRPGGGAIDCPSSGCTDTICCIPQVTTTTIMNCKTFNDAGNLCNECDDNYIISNDGTECKVDTSGLNSSLLSSFLSSCLPVLCILIVWYFFLRTSASAVRKGMESSE